MKSIVKINQKGAVDFMLIVLLIVIVAVGGFVFWQLQTTDETVSDTEVAVSDSNSDTIPTTIDGPLEIPDDWVQYSSASNGFSFSHPGDWDIQSTGDGEDEIVQAFSDAPGGTGIYACFDIRRGEDAPRGEIDLITDTENGFEIYSSGESQQVPAINLTNTANNSVVTLDNGNSFAINGYYNCVQNDFTNLPDDFNFVAQPEYPEMINIMRSFSAS